MNRRAFVVFVLLQWSAAALIAAAVGVRWVSPDPSDDLLVGLPAGVLLFLALNRQPLTMVAAMRTLTAPQACARATFFTVNTLAEEVVWRGWLLESLTRVTSVPAAAAMSAIGFAFIHLGLQGVRGVLTHLLTGTVFACAYLATHSVLAPFAAHLVYNLLFLGRSDSRPVQVAPS